MFGKYKRPRVPRSARVIRAGDLTDQTFKTNAEEHNEAPDTRGEWALSVLTLPDASDYEILKAAPWVRWKHYGVTTAGVLFDADFLVVEDGPPHGLLMLGGPGDETIWGQLRLLFSERGDNPFYEERRRSRARR